MAGVTVDIEGIQQVINDAGNLAVKLQDIRPIANDMFFVVQADVDQRFAGAPVAEVGGVVLGGENWEPLSDPYLRSNPRRQGGQILRDTGELLNSLGVGNPGNVTQLASNELVFGTNLPKAGGLQNKRPFLFVHPGLVSQLENLVVNYLEVG